MKAIIQQCNRDSGKSVLLTAIRFEDLLGDRVKITYKIKNDENPYDNWDGQGGNDFYQRKLDSERVKSIASYIRFSCVSDKKTSIVERPLFPNSMILAVELTNGELCSIDDELVVFEWDKIDRVYIVDGQHRYAGMLYLYNQLHQALFRTEEEEHILNVIKNYRFNCTVLINYDLWEQAEIFADINFKQKKVNKSLYYEIYGQFPPESPRDFIRSYIFLAHNLVNVLNYNDLSPLKGMIKMLGTGTGTVSQAYLVEAIVRHIQPDKAIWHFNAYDSDFSDRKYMHMAVELVSFFTAIKVLFPQYLGNSKSILSKTTGLGAMIRLIKDVHDRAAPEIKERLKDYTEVALDHEYFNHAKLFLEPLQSSAERLFGSGSQYAGGGSTGYVGKLYHDILNTLKQDADKVGLF